MSEHQHQESPHGDLPDYLEGLQPPVSVQEALAHAEERGASAEVLQFMESLPAAVFTSEAGMRNAFGSLDPDEIPETDPEDVLVGQDGTSS